MFAEENYARGDAILAELRRRDEERKVLVEALHADNLPAPPVTSFPPDPFAEEYRRWYHGKRADALRSALAAFQEPVTP